MARSKIDTDSADLRKRRGVKRKRTPPPYNWTVTVNNVNANSCLANGILDFLVEAPPGICYNNPTITFNLIDASGNYIVLDYSCVGGMPGAHVFTGTPTLYTLTWVNQLVGGTARIPYCNLPTGSYTFTIFSTTCSGVAGTNTPIVFNETITHTYSPLCKHWPELTVCYTSSDPVILNTLMGVGGHTYGTYFSMFGQVGQVMNNSCVHMPYVMHYIFLSQGAPALWYIDGVPLSSADIGKSFDLASFDPNLIGPSLYPIIPGAMFLTITDVCAPPAYQNITTPILQIPSTFCGPCDPVVWNSIPYGYTTQWLHWAAAPYTMSYNPPVVLPPFLINQGYTSPSSGGPSPPGFPGGYQMTNFHANIDYENQSSICEWCADWQTNNSIPGTFNPHVLNWPMWISNGWGVAEAEALCDCCPAVSPAGPYGGLSIPPTGTLV